MDMERFCYWSVADGRHGLMMQALIASARRVGVQEDFHVWTDMAIKDATCHPCGTFGKAHWMFKFDFLRDHLPKLPYEAFVFLDADNYFVRHPGNVLRLLGPDP